MKKPGEAAGSSQRETPPPSLRRMHYIEKIKKTRNFGLFLIFDLSLRLSAISHQLSAFRGNEVTADC
jgi:hypothetical protein